MNAAAVSRTLARAGLRPLPSGTSRMREGIRVSRGIADVVARVIVDFDDEAAAARRSVEVEEILSTAYTVERTGPTSLAVKA